MESTYKTHEIRLLRSIRSIHFACSLHHLPECYPLAVAASEPLPGAPRTARAGAVTPCAVSMILHEVLKSDHEGFERS
jgi:hypothetical protein